MPGLFGVVANGGPESSGDGRKLGGLLDQMAAALRHRPEYAYDKWIDGDGTFAIGRIGPAHANRCPWPAAPTNGRPQARAFVAGVLHAPSPLGEQAFEDLDGLGPERVLSALRGFYSVFLTDGNKRSSILAVDRSASIPLYYTEQNGCFYFAPEVKALLAIDGFVRKVDIAGMASLLANGFLLDDQTLFENIRKLPAGHAFSFAQGRLCKLRYFDFVPSSKPARGTEQDLIHELDALIAQSVARNYDDPTRTVLFLSGGVDSRGILAACLRRVQGHGQTITAVTWSAELHGPPDSDVEIAKQIAERFSLKHLLIVRDLNQYPRDFEFINYITEGMSKSSVDHPHENSIMESLYEDNFRIVLRGDEVFGWQGNVYDLDAAFLASGIRRLSRIVIARSAVRGDAYRKMCERNDAVMNDLHTRYGRLSFNNAKDQIYFDQRLQRLLQSAAYNKQVFFDHRNILLDDDILQFVQKIPEHQRVNKRLFQKSIFFMSKELSDMDVSRNYVPENWKRELSCDRVVGRYLNDQLQDNRSGIWEYIDPRPLRNLLCSLDSRRQKTIGSMLEGAAQRVARTVLSSVPGVTHHFKNSIRESYVSPENFLKRVLVLKHWHDRFIS